MLHVSGYRFADLDLGRIDRRQLMHEGRCRNLTGTVFLSPEGVNAYFAGLAEDVRSYQQVLRDHLGDGAPHDYRQNLTSYPPYRKFLVRQRPQLIPVEGMERRPVDDPAPAVTPRELKRWLDEGRPCTLVDMRNDYEFRVGTFAGAVGFAVSTFREVMPEAQRFFKTRPPLDGATKAPIVAFCTGGIRCDKLVPTLRAQFPGVDLLQLEGGILKYFEECGGDHYDGDCYVYDQRVALRPDGSESDAVMCLGCGKPVTPSEQRHPEFVPGRSCPECRVSSRPQAMSPLPQGGEAFAG